MIRLPISGRTALVGSASAGLGSAPFLSPETASLSAAALLLGLSLLSAIAWQRGLPGTRLLAGIAASVLLLMVGLVVGQARLAAIDRAAFRVGDGRQVSFEGHLESPPRSDQRQLRLHLAGPKGRVAVLSDRLDLRVRVGSGLIVKGRTEAPPEYLRAHLRRLGIRQVIRAETIARGPDRGGPLGFLDRVRERAVAAMGAGMSPREAALAAGFVLGQDGDIDRITEEHFRRSGLAHLVAASGQNVMLLVLLTTVPLALAGVRLRHRIPILVVVVLIYLPLAGAGPSIQRAAVMGVVMLLVLWLGGASSRALALAAAFALTLLVNPRASGDAGWQLSFAATVGIMALAPPLRSLLLDGDRRFRRKQSAPANPEGHGPVVRTLAEGTAVTVAATLATGPLVVHHFGALPLASLSANLLVLPAIAPTMWLGMIAGLAGQVGGLPTEPINALNAVLISYVAEVARAVSELPCSVAEISLDPGWLVALVEAGVVISTWAALRLLLRREARHVSAGLVATVVAVALLIPVVALLAPAELAPGRSGSPDGLRIVALDIGQGDAILIQVGTANLLVDTGPPGAGLVRRLRRYGVKDLEAVVITHGDLDHIGGLEELQTGFGIANLLHGDPVENLRGPTGIQVGAGHRLRLNDAVIDVLWPPPSPAFAAADRNARSLVLLLHWRGFKALFTGDAEAEAAPYSPGEIDLLKVAHHGSADRGLPGLLAEATPSLALISAGRDNSHGHPHPDTLRALQTAGARVHRTDLEGDLVLELP